MTGVLKFPKIGSEKTVQVYVEPEREADETAEDYQARVDFFRSRQGITADVRLVSRETARSWALRWESAIARDKKRIADAEKAGESTTQVTAEGLQDFSRLQREIVKASIVKVAGVSYGDVLLETMTDTDKLVQCLDDCELLTAVAAAVSRAQAPSPDQGKA